MRRASISPRSCEPLLKQLRGCDPSRHCLGEGIVVKKLAAAAGAAALVFTAGCAQLNADVKQSLYGDYAIAPLKVERNGTYAQLVSALTTAPADGVPPLVSASCFGSGASADPTC